MAATSLSQAAYAAGEQCVGKVPTIRVNAQPIPTIPFLDSQKGEFEKKWNTKVEIQQFGENDRRAKSRLDASQGTGAYQVYYIDEANVAEYSDSKWVLPLLDYMPKDWDWNDFLEGAALWQHGLRPPPPEDAARRDRCARQAGGRAPRHHAAARP